MLRSMFTAISGLKNHQTKMDVVANNIANVNTTAFKSSRVTFQDIYSQTLEPASAPTDGANEVGGKNPLQVGMGMTISTTDLNFTQAAHQSTGNSLDLALEGDGFFVVTDGANTYFTRAGNFTIDALGRIVDPNGYFLVQYDETSYLETQDLTEIEVDIYGRVTGLNSSGDREEIGTIGIARFSNNKGLEKIGGNLYMETPNSGAAFIQGSEDHGNVKVRSGSLEMSNVDLANEFTEMITTQRGFQANSRVITTSDSLLEELVNLKR